MTTYQFVANSAISSGLKKFIESQESPQSTVGCFKKEPTFTVPYSKLVRRHFEIVFLNEAKFYVAITIIAEKNEKAPEPSPLKG